MNRSVLIASSLSFGGATMAQPFVGFDGSSGQLPEDQCWVHREDINPPRAYQYSSTGSALFLSTLDLQATGEFGGGVWWESTHVAFSFSQAWAAEIRVRIVNAPNHSVNTGTGWPRPGFTLAVYDVGGRLFWLGFGTSEIFLSNTSFGQYGSANTLTLPFTTTDAFHIYRLERAPAGVGAMLSIDGVPRLTLAQLGPVESAAGLVYFGDPTYWANSASETAFVRYSGERCIADVDDGTGTGSCDGGVTIDDLLFYLQRFEAGVIAADVDDGSGTGTPDGGVTIDDLLYYLFRFEAGC